MTNMTIDQFVRERMFQPLGMRDTYYNIPQRQGRPGRHGLPARPGRPHHASCASRSTASRRPTSPASPDLNATAADYFRFAQMLLNGGEYDGQRLLGRMTVNQMFSNQIGAGKTVYVRGEGWGFGLGAGVLTDPAKSADGLSIGTWSWGGADGTLFYIDPRRISSRC